MIKYYLVPLGFPFSLGTNAGENKDYLVAGSFGSGTTMSTGHNMAGIGFGQSDYAKIRNKINDPIPYPKR
ncbi:hypothetical protein ABIB40_003897 [Pedobacter sp. UYP30]|uniref:hypothetical protein n=1 Tax=Pedobacter sp. UYP30 TaxID=1756400 RepID=UPI003396F9CB